MLDKNGYRLNVGIVLANRTGQLFWGKRINSHEWQFPQGGVHPYETLEETMYRELDEEVGLTKKDVTIIATTKRWLRYRLPIPLRRNIALPLCVGQKQKWFLLLLTSNDNNIRLNASRKPEFNNWYWIKYWAPLQQAVYFKRNTYRKVLTEFASMINNQV